MDSAPYCGLDVLQGLVELQGKRGREEEEEGAAEEEAGAVGRGSNKRRRTGQEEEVRGISWGLTYTWCVAGDRTVGGVCR
jgi:hypothetical protein